MLCSLITSCSKPQSEVSFQRGGNLTAAERAQITEINPYPTNGFPDFSAVWVQAGVTQRVYFRDGDIGGLSRSGVAFVFDSDGRLAEADTIEHANRMPRSLTIVSMSPLRLRFSYPDGWTEEGVGQQMEEFTDRFRHRRNDTSEISPANAE